jgi:hypothetical protein
MKMYSAMEKNKRRVEIYSKNQYGEYTVKFYSKGVHNKNANYFTDCLDDAESTATEFLNRHPNTAKIKAMLRGEK